MTESDMHDSEEAKKKALITAFAFADIPFDEKPTPAQIAARRRLLHGTVRRWELVPFVVALIALFLSGLASMRNFYEQREKDNQQYLEQICANGERNRQGIHNLAIALFERNRALTPEEEASARAFLEQQLPIVQPCGGSNDDSSSP